MHLEKYWIEYALGFFSLSLAVAYALYVYSLGLTTVYIDESSHLNIARQIFDSMTPGLSQVGFWPPLLHVLMSIPVSSDVLFRTGLAGAVTLIPFLVLSVILLYRLLTLLSENRLLSLIGALVFLINPYVLYYSVTPMMEMLFIAGLISTAYFLAEWQKTEKFSMLFLASLSVALASLSRFEGMLLFPVGALLLCCILVAKGRTRNKVEALLILFSMVAALGFVFILVYGYIFADNPLEFLNSNWSAGAQQKEYILPALKSISLSFTYLISAAYFMLGKAEVLIGLVSVVGILILIPKEKRIRIFPILLVLICPFLFVWFSLYNGETVVYVEGLPPYGDFFNERYGLSLVVFALVTPIIFLGLFVKRLANTRAVLKWSGFFGCALSLGVLISLALHLFISVTFQEDFRVIRKSVASYRTETNDQKAIGKALCDEYESGKIFITRALANFVTTHSCIPLKNFVQESNFRYYDEVLQQPWLFARYVVMYNPHSVDRTSWRGTNERISYMWANSAEFKEFYTLLLETPTNLLYKLNEKAVRDYALAGKLTISNIVSLTPRQSWNPDTIYKEMGVEREPSATKGSLAIQPSRRGDTKQLLAMRSGTDSSVSKVYVVAEGDCLWRIAEEYYSDGFQFEKIVRANAIPDASIIYVGEHLIIPYEK